MNDFNFKITNQSTIREWLISTCNFANITERKDLSKALGLCLLFVFSFSTFSFGQCPPATADTEAPTMVCNGTFVFTLSTAQDGAATFTLDDTDLRQIAAGTSDNCSAFADLVFSVDNSDFDCGDLVGTQNIVITVADESGNMTSCNTMIDIQDGTNPVAVCADPVGAPAPAWAQGESAYVTIVGGSGNLDANALGGGNSTDNCATTIETSPFTIYDCDDIGTQLVQLTVTDGVGKTDMIMCNVIVGPPLPTATSGSEAAQCSGTAVSVTLDDYLDAVSEDATYTIASTNYNGMTGSASISGGETLEDNVTNTTGGQLDVVYTITPTHATSDCPGTDFNVTIPIDPEPDYSDSTNSECSDVTFIYDLGFNTINGLLGDEFTYTVTSSDAGNVPPAADRTIASVANINDTYINTTSAAVTITYTVTPTSMHGCEGDAFDVIVTINPEPVGVSYPLGGVDFHNCSGDALFWQILNNVADVVQGANNVTSTYDWTAAYPPGLTGGDGSGTATIDETLINSTTGPLDAVYTITPTSDPDGCVGADFTITWTIEPAPESEVSAATEIICSGNSPVATTGSLTTAPDGVGDAYLVDAALTSGTASGFTASQSGVAASANIDAANITNTSNAIATVTYTVTAYTFGSDGIDDMGGNDDCVDATPATVVVTVEPVPNIIVTQNDPDPQGLNNILCSGYNPNWTFTTDIIPSSLVRMEKRSTINGTLVDYGILTLGTYGECTGGTCLINTGTDYFDFVPECRAVTAGPDGVFDTADDCFAPWEALNFQIEPAPQANDPADEIICSGENGAFDVTTDLVITNTSFNWTAVYGAVTGGAGSATSVAYGTDAVNDGALSNVTAADIDVTYTITPYTWGPNEMDDMGAGDDCIGPAFDVIVTVQSEPVVADQTVTECSDVALGVNFNASTGEVADTYNVTALDLNGLTVSAGDADTDLLSLLAVDLADDAFTNTTSAAVIVTYTVVPVSTDGCEGEAFTVEATINPAPVGEDSTEEICSDEAFDYNPQDNVDATGGNSVPSTFAWSAVYDTGLTGGGGAGTGNVTETLNNGSGGDLDATYTITPTSADGCLGETFEIVVTIYSEPVGADSTMEVCSDEDIDYNPQANVDDTANGGNSVTSMFIWTASYDPGLLNGIGAGSGNIIDNVNNETGGDLTATYTVTPTSSIEGCEGETFEVVVTVKPEPVVTDIARETCSGERLDDGGANLLPSVSDNGLGIGAEADAWDITSVVADAGLTFISGLDAGQTATITDEHYLDNDIWENKTTGDLDVVFTVTPKADNGCEGDPFTITVTIHPKPDGVDQEFTVCSGDNFDFNPEDYINNFVTGMQWTIDYTEDIFVENEYLDGGGSSALGTETVTSTAPIVNNSTNTRVLVYTVNPQTAIPCLGDPFTITINVLPLITAVIDVPGDLELCVGEATVLSSTVVPAGTYDYSWTIDGSSTSAGSELKDPINTDQVELSPGGPGTVVVTLTVTDPSSGCVAATDMVTYNINANPVASISDTETEICEGEEVTLTASGGTSYVWSDASTGASITVTPTQSMVYQVTATNASGCTDIAAIPIIVTPQPVAPQTTDDEVCQDDTTSSLTADCADNVGLPAEISSESLTGLNTPVDGTSGFGDPIVIADLVNIGTLDFTGDFTTGALIDEVTITLTFEKRGVEDCGTNAHTDCTFNNEIVFYLQSSVGVEGFLVENESYKDLVTGDRCVYGGEVTITLDAASLNSLVGQNPPLSGTYMPTTAFLGGFNSLPADALTFTLLAGDTARFDPLCVRGFEATVTTLETGNCQVEWYDALIDGNLVFTGEDYDPIANGDVDASVAGDYPFFAACVCDGCPSERTQAILTVNANPVVSITAQADLCEFGDPVFLEATPAGGGWSGTGITNTSLGEFDPEVAGVGTHTITYMSTDGNGCTGENTIDIVVFADTQAPTFDFCPPATPPGYTYDAGTNTFTVTVSPAVCQVEPEWIDPIATDNCVLVSQTDNVQNFYTPGLYTITYRATDMANLQTICTFNFEVLDETDPNIIGCQSSVTFDTATDECDYEYTWNTPAVNDPCGLFTWEVAYTDGAIVPEALPASGALSSTLSQSVTETFYLGETVVTYTATDGSGNTATCEFTVTITEDDDPSFVDPVDISLTTSGQLGEDCPADAGFSFAALDVIVSGSTHQFAGVDFTAPSSEDPTYPAVGAGGYSDACDHDPVLSVLSIADNSVDGCAASFVVTWIVTDDNGNTATQDQAFDLTDDEAPTIADQTDLTLNTEDFAVDCPAVAMSSIEDGDVVAIDGTYMICGVTINAPTSTDITDIDNCNVVRLTALTVTHTPGTCSASYEIVWQVDDGCSNSSTTTQMITIVDDSPAIFTEDEPDPVELVLSDLDVDCLADITTVQVNGSDVTLPHTFAVSDELTIGGEEIEIPFADVEDNCNADPTIKLIAVSLEADSDECDHEWILEFTVEDGCNDVDLDDSSYELTILIEDDVPAIFDPVDEDELELSELSAGGVCPSDAMTMYGGDELEEGDEVDLGDDIMVGGIAVTVPEATDIEEGCTDLELTVGEISKTITGCSYEVTITWLISDGCTDDDDLDEFEQTIIISDDAQATAVAPDTVTYTVLNDGAVCAEFGDIDLDISDMFNYDPSDPQMFKIAGIENGVNTALLTPMDNCNTVVLTVADLVIVEDTPCQNTTFTITWLVSDGCNPGIEVDQVFMIEDDQDPTGTTPDGEVDVNSCADETTIDLLIPVSGDIAALEAAFTDNGCGTVSATFNSQALTGDDTSWTLGREFTIADDCGNTFDVTMTHTGFDQDDPVITCPTDKVLPLSTTCDVMLPDYTSEAVVMDCSNYVVTQDPPAGTMYTAETVVTVTLTATDDKGNDADCTFNVSIEDQIAPTPICQSITVQLDAAGMVSITTADIDNGSFDACGIDNMVLDMTDFTCANIGDNAVTLTVTDIYGNDADCTATVTVEDMVSPMITCPADETIVIVDANDCTVDYDGVAMISDNCSLAADINVTASIVLNLVAGGTGPTGTVTLTNDGSGNIMIDADDLRAGDNVITLTATDGNGQVSTCDFTITVEDTFGPQVNFCPGDISVTAPAGDCEVAVSFAQPVFNDPCDNFTISFTHQSGNLFPVGETTTVVWTATDDSGNTAECTFDITVDGTCVDETELTLTYYMAGASFAPGSSKDAIFTVDNIGTADSELAEVLILKPGSAAFSTSYSSTTTMVTTGSFNVTTHNSDWDVVVDNGSFVYLKLKPGVSIPAGGFSTIGISFTAVGVTGNTAATEGDILVGTGGDQNPDNNEVQQSMVIN